MGRLILFVLAFFALAAPAHALSAARLGVAAHNVRFSDSDTQSHEGGVNFEAEALSKPIAALRMVGAPRAYVMASVNSNGDTSFVAAGLYWRLRLNRDWTLEPGFGVAVHDGARHNPYGSGDPRAAQFAHDHQLLGSRWVFRDSLALDRRVGEGRAVGIVFEHLSNGGALFGHSDNQSLNEIGVRYTIALN